MTAGTGEASLERLWKRAAHSGSRWGAVVYGCCGHFMTVIPSHRDGSDDFVFTGYLSEPVSGIYAVEIYSEGELVADLDVNGLPSSPCRITLTVGPA